MLSSACIFLSLVSFKPPRRRPDMLHPSSVVAGEQTTALKAMGYRLLAACCCRSSSRTLPGRSSGRFGNTRAKMYYAGVLVSKCRDACRCNTSLAERLCLHRCSMSGTSVTLVHKPYQAKPFSLLHHNPDLGGASPFCHARPIPVFFLGNWLEVDSDQWLSIGVTHVS
jgi:hypothetical protein